MLFCGYQKLNFHYTNDLIISGERIKSAWVLQDQHYICALLHPSLKHFDQASDDKVKALELIKQELLKRATSVMSDAATNTSSNSLSSRCFDRSKPMSTPLDELENSMSLNEQISEQDVLLFWKRNAKSFPLLSSIVRDLFAAPASNTSEERLFSSSKNTVSDR